MTERAEKTKIYSVRIWNGEAHEGSGVLWRDEMCAKNKIYIFTAAHVVENKTEIKVEFEHDGIVEAISVENDKIFIAKGYSERNNLNDIAVMEIEYEYLNFPSYKIANWSEEFCSRLNELFIKGFPKNGYKEDSFLLSRADCKCGYREVDKNINTLKYVIESSNLDVSDRDDELVGLSGAGIFIEEDSNYTLIGIHTNSVGNNAARGELLGITSDLLIKTCMNNGITIQAEEDIINGNLSDRKEFFLEEIVDDLKENNEVAVMKILGIVLEEDMTEIINGMFCNFCEECKYKTSYHQCEFFRGYLLVIAVFLKAINEKMNLVSPKIKKEGDMPIYFICSEGRGMKDKDKQTKLKISNFIYALKSDRSLSSKLEKDCIIIWGAKRTVKDNHKRCNQKDYEKYLSDITRIDRKNLDITKIFKENSPRIIIHIDEINRMLSKEKIEDLYEIFVKYIDEVEHE